MFIMLISFIMFILFMMFRMSIMSAAPVLRRGRVLVEQRDGRDLRAYEYGGRACLSIGASAARTRLLFIRVYRCVYMYTKERGGYEQTTNRYVETCGHLKQMTTSVDLHMYICVNAYP